MLFAILEIVKDVRRKTVGFQVLAMNLLCRDVVQNARKRTRVQECMGSVILQFSSIKKSRASERVKRDPHVFDLVLFLHPKKCLTCGGETFALLLVLETVPLTFMW